MGVLCSSCLLGALPWALRDTGGGEKAPVTTATAANKCSGTVQNTPALRVKLPTIRARKKWYERLTMWTAKTVVKTVDLPPPRLFL